MSEVIDFFVFVMILKFYFFFYSSKHHSASNFDAIFEHLTFSDAETSALTNTNAHFLLFDKKNSVTDGTQLAQI